MSMVGGELLPTSFYARDTVRVARALLGCIVESRIGGRLTSGRIVEVEGYVGPQDPAAHGYGNRRTQRNAALFGPPGTSYVYFIYGMHWCFNAVTERDGYPAAVLLRALEPMEGVDVMGKRRGISDLRRLCSGPARLSQALGITASVNGSSLVDGPVCILRPPTGRSVRIDACPRIGISKASEWPLRFLERGSPWVSRPVAGNLTVRQEKRARA
jgi:DNA-3-methyladenine glycosylase